LRISAIGTAARRAITLRSFAVELARLTRRKSVFAVAARWFAIAEITAFATRAEGTIGARRTIAILARTRNARPVTIKAAGALSLLAVEARLEGAISASIITRRARAEGTITRRPITIVARARKARVIAITMTGAIPLLAVEPRLEGTLSASIITRRARAEGTITRRPITIVARARKARLVAIRTTGAIPLLAVEPRLEGTLSASIITRRARAEGAITLWPLAILARARKARLEGTISASIIARRARAEGAITLGPIAIFPRARKAWLEGTIPLRAVTIFTRAGEARFVAIKAARAIPFLAVEARLEGAISASIITRRARAEGAITLRPITVLARTRRARLVAIKAARLVAIKAARLFAVKTARFTAAIAGGAARGVRTGLARAGLAAAGIVVIAVGHSPLITGRSGRCEGKSRIPHLPVLRGLMPPLPPRGRLVRAMKCRSARRSCGRAR
jgi:hypothetical protein